MGLRSRAYQEGGAMLNEAITAVREAAYSQVCGTRVQGLRVRV